MAKKVKSAKAAKVALCRPIISPYASPLVTLHFGPTHQKYYLPEVLLQRLENIPSRDDRTGEIHLADVDASIGHVLVHFLYTGVYQTLNDEDIEDVDKSIVCKEFQKAALVLEAAKKHGVPGLRDVAQMELERLGKEMDLRYAVRAIREASIAESPDGHAWLRDYVLKKVQWTFEYDLPTLSAPDLFESIESPTLTKILAQIIVGLYSEELDKLRKGKTTVDEISAPDLPILPSKHVFEASTSWPASVEKFGAFDDSVAAWDPQDLPHYSVGRTPDLPILPSKLTFEASTAWPASVEKFGAFDDSVAAWDAYNLRQDPGDSPEASMSVGLPSSIKEENGNELLYTVRQHAKASDVAPQQFQQGIAPSPIDQATKQNTTAAVGFMNDGEEKATSSFPPITTPIQPLEDGLLASENAVNDMERMKVNAAAKKKEDTGSRESEEGVAESQHLQAEQADLAQPQERDAAAVDFTPTDDSADGVEVQQLFDNWGDFPFIPGKKKPTSKTGSPPPQSPLTPPPLKNPPPPASPPNMQLEVDQTPIITDIATIVSTVPAAQEDPKAEVDPYARLSKSQAKKLKIKLDREAKAIKPQEMERQKEDKADKIKRWEEQKAKQARLEEEDAEQIRLEEEEAERTRLEEEKAGAAATASDLIAFGSTIETGATPEDDEDDKDDYNCELRLEHLSQHDGWHDCKPCGLYMRKIAIKLYSGGLTNLG